MLYVLRNDVYIASSGVKIFIFFTNLKYEYLTIRNETNVFHQQKKEYSIYYILPLNIRNLIS